MNKLFLLFATFSILLFFGCDDKEDPGQLLGDPPLRNLKQKDIESIKYATIESYPEVGWNFLVLSVKENQFSHETNFSFHVDIIYNKSKIKEGTFNCKDTDSFKKYAAFKCNMVNYLPNDIVTIKQIDENNYSISFSYYENGQLFEGKFEGAVNIQFWSIDFLPECYDDN